MENNLGPKIKILIRTFGCAMNYYDSEFAEGILEAAGYKIIHEADGPESLGDIDNNKLETQDHKLKPTTEAPRNADIILINTCSVREHAEDRVFGRLGLLGKAKKTNPDLVVGLMGCMVEEHREQLFKRFPQLDFMVGTRNIKDLPNLIDDVYQRRKQVAIIQQEGISIEYTDKIKRHGKYHAWLPIMTGCDKKCTFCIVPKTRGSEVSMTALEVYREAQRLAGNGAKWITLLGQNVNSYCGSIIKPDLASSAIWPPRNDDLKNVIASEAKQSENSSVVTFPQLLEMLCQIDGLERISFTTSHPQDATEELFQVIAKNPKISRRFHLPLQSGSDKILKRMKRLHTFEDFAAKVNRLRELVPDICVTTDMIVGFPGESKEDYEATIHAIETIRFDGAYIYKYSERPGTPAARLADDVPLKVKEQRHQELLNIQKQIMLENHQKSLGQTLEVFVEAVSAKSKTQLVGRSIEEKKVVFDGSKKFLGTFQKVKLLSLCHDTFIGKLQVQPIVNPHV